MPPAGSVFVLCSTSCSCASLTPFLKTARSVGDTGPALSLPLPVIVLVMTPPCRPHEGSNQKPFLGKKLTRPGSPGTGQSTVMATC